jgi:hypothetical protein
LADLVGVTDLLAQDAKLVTAHSGYEVAGTHRDAKALRDLDQQSVAGAVAEGVIDVLKPVQVEEHDRGGRVVPSRATERIAIDMGPFGFDASKGSPPDVVGAVVAWLVTTPEGRALNGTWVEAQDKCRELGLLPDWDAQAG